jgi:hypothetical protein
MKINHYTMETIERITGNRMPGTAYYTIAQALADYCCGGGFDGKWLFKDQGSYVLAVADWRLMDQDGFYVGYYGFKVVIPKKEPAEFRLYGMHHNKRVLERYGVWEYLDQVIYGALTEGGMRDYRYESMRKGGIK